MRYISTICLALVLSSSGCALFQSKAEADKKEFIQKKTVLERQIELLRLERRKLLIQQDLDEIDTHH